MTGVAPQLPSYGWRVLYQDALQRFLAAEANLEYAGAVSDWIVACRKNGPPPDGIEAGGDLYLSRVGDMNLSAEYMIIEYEYLIICKDFRFL